MVLSCRDPRDPTTRVAMSASSRYDPSDGNHLLHVPSRVVIAQIDELASIGRHIDAPCYPQSSPLL